MTNKEFMQRIGDLTGLKPFQVQWSYWVDSTNISDGADDLFQTMLTLQVELLDSNRDKVFISIDAYNYCYNPKQVIDSLLSYFEVSNSSFEALGAKVDTDKVFDLMHDYLLQYGDTEEKNKEEPVFFESW